MMIRKLFFFESYYFEQNQSMQKIFYWLQQILLFALRLWIFDVFFFSGWLKLSSWDTTIMLFEYEYSVPFVSPLVGAYLATFAELFFPCLLIVGIYPRLSALALFVLNIIAAISYADISAAGNQQHMLWGLMLLVLFINSSGKIQLSSLFGRARSENGE